MANIASVVATSSKASLQPNLLKKCEHFRTKATQSQQLQHGATDHFKAMQLKTETKAPASNAATDHIETEFHIDDALENRTSTQSTAEYRTSASIARSSNTADELQQTSGNHRTTASCSQSLATDRTADQLIQNIN